MREIDYPELRSELPETEFQFKQFGEKTDIVVVGLHGWTGDEQSLIPVSIGVRCPNSLWVLPRAPFKAQKIPKGFSWYDKPPDSKKELMFPIRIIEKIVEYFRREMGDEIKIFLLGFSQGAALSAGAGLYLDSKLNGVISIAGFVRKEFVELSGIKSKENFSPILILHGTKDEIVPIEKGNELKNVCTELGQKVEFITYEGKHKIPVSVMRIIREFITD
jgi:predicted esterase|tara:strand:+ start:227 stop:883 length:657 start_codon:yes stop_codon:yes gene_type:complete